MAKQMKIFHLKGFTEDELRQYKVQVHQNILKNMKTLVKGAEDRYIQIQNEVRKRSLFRDIHFFFPLTTCRGWQSVSCHTMKLQICSC